MKIQLGETVQGQACTIEYFLHPDGEQVRWLVSSEWPRDPESKGLVGADEEL